jgi:alpha-L-fucosidase 2
VKGLRGRGGFEVSLSWKDGSLASAEIKSLHGNPCRVRVGNTVKDLNIRAGKVLSLRVADFH